MIGGDSAGIVVSASIDAIEQVSGYLEERLEVGGVSMMESARIQLAVEEAVTNVVTHGYEQESGMISVTCEIISDQVRITIVDSGPAFDPTKIPPADTISDLEHRMIGGLGVHLIRSVMDEIYYTREKDANRLTLIKRL